MIEADRYNDNKVRLDLVPPSLEMEVGQVLTKALVKYEENNWRRGMKWNKCIASLKRHLNSFQQGEDLDPETGEKHITHVIVNAMFLMEYYTICPNLDDRIKTKK